VKRRRATSLKATKAQPTNKAKRGAPKPARKRRATVPSKHTEVAQLARERDDAIEQLSATSEVLKVISQSGAELGPLLDTLVATAARICLAESGFIFQLQDGLCRMVASFGIPPEYKDFQESNPIVPGRGTLAGRTVLERRAVHIEDAAADPEYTRIQAVHLGNQRTMLGVPLVRDDALIGVITLARSHVKAFSEKEIGLVATFADQAVVAIENTRLLNELRESLQQQTATAEIMGVISRSLGDLTPVFETMLANAVQLCQAKFGLLYLYEDGALHTVAATTSRPHLPIREKATRSVPDRVVPLVRLLERSRRLILSTSQQHELTLSATRQP